MSKGIKLAVLLKDVADQPEAPAAAQVSLNVLQDAAAIPERPAWRRHFPKFAVTLAAITVLGGIAAFVFDLKIVIPARLAPWQQAQISEPTKAKQKETPSPDIDRSAFSKPVQELMQYADDLRQRRVAFGPGITGEEAAKQLVYTRLFASAYDEMALRAKALQRDQERPHINDIIAGFEAITREEQAIDQLLAKRERHATSIAYLRALQNGDVAFPGPQPLAPTPAVLLIQLMTAHPDVEFNINDRVFATIYRDTREFVSTQMKAAEEVWAPEIIAEFRRLILQSAARPEPNTSPTACEKGAAIGKLLVVTKFCPRLRLNQAAIKILEEVAQQGVGNNCRDRASAGLQTQLEAMPPDSVEQVCQRALREVLAGKNDALEIAH